MKKTILKKYAELIVRSGLALRKGQPVIITANLDQEDFVSLVVEECYKAGASHVYLDWKSEKVARITNKKGKLKDLKQVLPMELAYQQWFTDALPARLWIDSDDPDAAKGLDAAKMAEIKKAHYAVCAPLIEARENKYQWCIAGAPSKAWAKKVFPDLSPKQAYEKLW